MIITVFVILCIISCFCTYNITNYKKPNKEKEFVYRLLPFCKKNAEFLCGLYGIILLLSFTLSIIIAIYRVNQYPYPYLGVFIIASPLIGAILNITKKEEY